MRYTLSTIAAVENFLSYEVRCSRRAIEELDSFDSIVRGKIIQRLECLKKYIFTASNYPDFE